MDFIETLTVADSGKLNQKSDYLVILVGTYNRLEFLKRVLESLRNGVEVPHEVIVIDGGSTDGTVEYLKSCPDVLPVLQGKLLGPAKAYNEVWRRIDSRYTCWLSDDTEIVKGAMHEALNILECNPSIGMVGLKMKDVTKGNPYQGSFSPYGILNCAHAVLSTSLLSSVGYFNEDYPFYMIDPDLTASVLCTGKKVVMTKAIGVIHHREWIHHDEPSSTKQQRMADSKRIYMEKFHFLRTAGARSYSARHLLGRLIYKAIFPDPASRIIRFGGTRRDWRNVLLGRFISPLDSLRYRSQPYHLCQQIPSRVVMAAKNPYLHLVTQSAPTVTEEPHAKILT